MEKGFFIAIEGIDGCGSTTHTKLLGSLLESKKKQVYLTREPSLSTIGKVLREYLKKKDIPIPTDALLFAADRVEHYYNEILPKLESGYIVISDRYIESSIAYQAAQSIFDNKSFDELSNAPNKNKFEMSIEWIENINKFSPKPDLTIILDIEPEKSLKRKYPSEDNVDKFENYSFLKIVREVYLKRAEDLNYSVISSDAPLPEVLKNIEQIVMEKLKI